MASIEVIEARDFIQSIIPDIAKRAKMPEATVAKALEERYGWNEPPRKVCESNAITMCEWRRINAAMVAVGDEIKEKPNIRLSYVEK